MSLISETSFKYWKEKTEVSFFTNNGFFSNDRFLNTEIQKQSTKQLTKVIKILVILLALKLIYKIYMISYSMN